MSANFPTRKLPQQPSLEQLRKQAKELLQQYRNGDAAITEEVRRFERQPVSPEQFALTDAQRVLARAYGYESWSKLKTIVDGANIAAFAAAVQVGDLAGVRKLLHGRPELVGMDRSASDEHRGLHYAVLNRDSAMVRLLMEAGADARKGIFPHRDATSALALARDRDYDEIVTAIEDEERLRREEMSCPNATISPVQEQINAAIARGDQATAVGLLEADLSLIHACDREGGTPLHVAAEKWDQGMVDWLLDRRANVRKEDKHGLTSLDRAAVAVGPTLGDRVGDLAGFMAIARRLLESGALMTIRAAIAMGEGAAVRELVGTDAGLLRQTRRGRNGGLVTLAVNHGQTEMVRLLLDLGADVDERIVLEELEEPTLSWGMPLWNAALGNRYEMAELLLDRGADPNANVYASGWPLSNAWSHEDGSLKQLLMARGAKLQPYMVAEVHDVREAKRLLDSDTSEELARELVWSAADHGCPEIVELALGRLEWSNDDPRWHWILIQPIRGASGSTDNGGFFACMDLLLRRGLDPNVSRFGATILHYAAARHGSIGGADRARFGALLLDHGAKLDVRDDLLRSTPLGWACRWGHAQLVELLIARGAPVEEPDAEPWARPLAWAKKMKHDAVVAMLSDSVTGSRTE